MIESVAPCIDAGRHAIKRCLGESVDVEADIYKDGHDLIAARVAYRPFDQKKWNYAPMSHNPMVDRWSGSFEVDQIGRWAYAVEAWPDKYGTWCRDLRKWMDAGTEIETHLAVAVEMLQGAMPRAKGKVRKSLTQLIDRLGDASLPSSERAELALSAETVQLAAELIDPSWIARSRPDLVLWVDRERAGFGAWYELFPRSLGPAPGRHGTFADAERRLPDLADLGFDVVYLPPIHPIGTTHRKGKNNTLRARPGDPGSPWAIGNEHGGHTAIEPALGTLEDFDRFVSRANDCGLEIALDNAFQCSPDHPWVKEHPDWFFMLPDGSIRYAENPPKKYEDIYPLNFWCEDREALWNACRDVFLFWIDHGVRIFRVDNPHTKPFAFWEWLIQQVHERHPDIVFLSESFTRPKVMKGMAKIGFTQSYTYFTWRNAGWELREYLTELTQTEMIEYFRPNFFANTPDILHEYLQRGGRPAFRVRLLLAATLSPSYGIYSGFELCENIPVRPGSEEYLDSEKYQIRQRDWSAPGNITDDIGRINLLRRRHPALQQLKNIRFYTSENDAILFYHKWAGDEHLLMAVNLDPFHRQSTMVHVPLDEIGLGPDVPYEVHDLLTDDRYTWRGPRNYVEVDPGSKVGHIFRVNVIN